MTPGGTSVPTCYVTHSRQIYFPTYRFFLQQDRVFLGNINIMNFLERQLKIMVPREMTRTLLAAVALCAAIGAAQADEPFQGMIIGGPDGSIMTMPACSAGTTTPGTRHCLMDDGRFGKQIVGQARVIDGDTLAIDGTRIRLDGIDAPELHQMCGRPSLMLSCGESAKMDLTFFAAAHMVNCVISGGDRYGRYVGVCGVREKKYDPYSMSAPREDFAEALVRKGAAVRYPQYDRECRYCAAEDEAKRERRGLWATEFEMPWVWRRKQKDGR